MTAQTAATPPAGGTATTQTDSKKVKPAGTPYLILEEGDGDTWKIVGGVTARDDKAAITKHSETHDNAAGKFVAIPPKRWKPLTVTPQTVTTLKLEEAK